MSNLQSYTRLLTARLALLALLMAVMASTAVAQAAPTGKVTLQRGGALGAVTLGEHLYIGQGATVVTLAADGRLSPEVIDVTEALPGLVRGLAIREDVLYAIWRTDEPSGQIALFSLADPAQPALIANIPYSDSRFLGPGSLTIVGTTLYVVDSEVGLLPIDVSNPAEPVVGTPVSTFGLSAVAPYDADHLVAWGSGFLGGLSVSIFDISTPSSPVQVGAYGGGNHFDIVPGDGFIVLTGEGFQVVSLADPANPTLLAEEPGADGFTGTIVDRHLLLGWEGAIRVWDLSEPARPVEKASIPARAGRTRLMAPSPVAGQTFMLTDRALALAVDTTNASSPEVDHVLDLPVGASVLGAATTGSIVVVADNVAGLRTLDASLESVGRLDLPSALPVVEDVDVEGDLALLADWGFGVHTVDLSDPSVPLLLGSVEFPFVNTVELDLVRNRGWAVSSTNGGFFVSLDLGDPSQPQITSQIAISQGAEVHFDGDEHVYVADKDGIGMRIFNVAGAAPTEVAQYSCGGFSGGALGVDVQGGVAALACSNGELHLIDVSDAGSPQRLGVYADTSIFIQGSAALFNGEQVFFGYTAGLDIVDVSDPANPSLAQRIELPGGVPPNGGLARASGGGVWVAAGQGGAALILTASDLLPGIKVTPTTLIDFGSVPVGSSADPVAVTIESTGTAALTVSSITEPGNGFTRVGGSCAAAPFALQPGTNCTVDFGFTPPAEGVSNSIVTIVSDDGSVGVPLRGTGTAAGNEPQPEVLLSAASFDFGFVEQGGGSAGRIALSNTGVGDLQVTNISDPGAPFSLGLAGVFGPAGVGLCVTPPFTLLPGASCEIEVLFNPSTKERFSASFNILSNAPSSPDTVTLLGTGATGDGGNGEAAIPVPAMQPWAIALLAGLLGLFGWLGLRRTWS